ncbi:hypothetical protein, variant [Sphaeroforma arctica JP610]|uniref:Fungal lipase-type domain-containing protein n=1 Tax=Sphaeroforma arctica JP610 TaxID=667725 RepID=A0A0L0FY59_9EUKA|nr:hypothetical protein, variant [Sphaeroforma arctica JP610]KNC81501.1 hypothetical protein, variant [Sphaeroforma arctica JP610]|eukprot:XP_014155403.1 hypothetical protein, variant [Sphaeroforma arctica JP610]
MAREHERVQQKHSGGGQSHRKCPDTQPAALKCICIVPDGRVGVGVGVGEGAVGETHCVCRGRLGTRQTVGWESGCVEGTTNNEQDTQTQTHARKHSRKTAVFRSYTSPDKAERLSEAGFVHNPYYGPGRHGVVGSGGNLNIDLTRGAGGGESAQASAGAAAGEGAHGMGAARDTVSGNHVRITDQQAVMGKDVDGSAMDVSAHHDSVMGEGGSHQEAETDTSPTRERRVDEGAKGNPGRIGRNSLASLKALFSGIGRKESIAEGTGEGGADGGTQPPTQHPTDKHTQQHTAKPTHEHARRLAQSYDTALAQEVIPEDTPQSSPWASGGAAEGSVSALPEGVVQPTDETYPHVFITGHSLGGSLATLFALDCAIRFPELKSTVYTFGSPRVGNKNFAAYYDEKVPHTFRLVNDGDVVTGVPKFKGPSFLNITYKHVGTCYVLSARGDLVINPNFPERFLKVAATINPQSHLTAAYRNSIAGCIGSALRRQRGNDNETMLTALQTLTTVLQAPSYMCKDVDRDVDGGQAWAGSHATFDRTIASGSRRVARRQHTTAHESLFTMRKMQSVRRRVSNFALASKSKSDVDTLVNDSGVPEATGTDQGRRRVASLPGVQVGDGTASTTHGTHLETREAGIYEPGHASIGTASGGDQGNHGNLSMSSNGAGYAQYDAAAELNNSKSAFPSSSSTTAAKGVQSHSLAMNPETTLSPLEGDGNTQTLAQSSERQTSTLPSNRHTAGGCVPPRRKSDGVDMKAIVNQVLANGNNVSFDVIAGDAGARVSETELPGSGGAELNKGAKKAPNVEGGMPQLQETRSVRYKQSGKPLLQHALKNAAQEKLAVPAYEHTVIAMNAQQMAELEMVQRDTERTREPLSASLSSFVDKNATGIAQKFRDSVRRRHGTPAQGTDRLPKGLDDLESSMGVEMTTAVSGGDMLNDESGSVAKIDAEIVNSIPQLHTKLKNKGDG